MRNRHPSNVPPGCLSILHSYPSTPLGWRCVFADTASWVPNSQGGDPRTPVDGDVAPCLILVAGCCSPFYLASQAIAAMSSALPACGPPLPLVQVCAASCWLWLPATLPCCEGPANVSWSGDEVHILAKTNHSVSSLVGSYSLHPTGWGMLEIRCSCAWGRCP